jgi:hypothetical protein
MSGSRQAECALAAAKEAASSPDTAPEELARLAEHEDDQVARIVAKNPNTPANTLAFLAEKASSPGNIDSTLLENVCRNLSTPLSALANITNNKRFSGLHIVSEARETMMKIQGRDLPRFLSYSQWEGGLESQAFSTTDWADGLFAMLGFNVMIALACNDTLPAGLLKWLAKHKWHPIRSYAAANPSLPMCCLRSLGQDENPEVRRGVTQNPKCPKDLLAVLAEDPNDTVRASALAALRGETPRTCKGVDSEHY